MADLFVSYAREDREVAERFAEAMTRLGLTVWWDRRIQVGRSYSEVIERELDSAKCVVVIWTSASIKSEWVSAEAAEGRLRGILVPILIDDVRPPLEFRRLQTATLDRHISDTIELRECVAAIKTILGQSTPVGDSSAPEGSEVVVPAAGAMNGSRALRSRALVISVVLLSGALIAGLWWWGAFAGRFRGPQPSVPSHSAMTEPQSTVPDHTSGETTLSSSETSGTVPATPLGIRDLVGTWNGRRPGDDPSPTPALVLELRLNLKEDGVAGDFRDDTPPEGMNFTTVSGRPAGGEIFVEFAESQYYDEDKNPMPQGHRFDGRSFTVRWISKESFGLDDDTKSAAYVFTRAR